MRYRTAFDDLFDVFNDFDDMFRRAFPEANTGTTEGSRLLSPGTRGGSLAPTSGVTGRAWVPTVESFVKDGSYHLRVELPGVDPADVNISLTGDQLTVGLLQPATEGRGSGGDRAGVQQAHQHEVSLGRGPGKRSGDLNQCVEVPIVKGHDQNRWWARRR